MFGYVVPGVESLSEDEKARYHDAYCGLCRVLGQRCGQRCRLALTYDLVFLALLLNSLYEPEEHTGVARCLPHPVHPHGFVRSTCTDYAADVTVALAYYKALDDWHDDHSVRGRASAALLEAPYRAVQKRNPRVCNVVESGMAQIDALEAAAREDCASGLREAESEVTLPPPDAAANCFGRLMGELFVYDPSDYWANDLRVFGARLGKFVYVMDAALDREDDLKTGNYNPLAAMDSQPEDIKESLELLIASAVEAFEKLPLEQDIHLLRSVLYSGVWQQYNAKFEKDTHVEDKEKHRG